MAASRELPRADWQPFFDRVSGAVLGKRVEIEAASLDLGDQIVAEWVPIIGITYDTRNDLIDVALAGLNHLIRRPERIYVQEGPEGLDMLAVVSAADDVKHVLRLKEPLMLPAQGGEAQPT